MNRVYIAPDNLLITPVNDFYRKSKEWTTEESMNYQVGVIRHVGKGLSSEWIDKICFQRLIETYAAIG